VVTGNAPGWSRANTVRPYDNIYAKENIIMHNAQCTMHNAIPKVAAVHDMSGFGKCSLTVALPIMSAMGIEAIPLPTALLSTHTGGFEGYTFLNLTDEMRRMIAHWRTLDLKFDAIYSGFLGESDQIDILEDFITSFKPPLTVVDPVMGDNGRLYSTITPEMTEKMRNLITRADVITPNLTEAAFLLNEPYTGGVMDFDRAKECLSALSGQGERSVVLTGVEDTDGGMYVAVYDKADGNFRKLDCNYIPGAFHGTGDIYASVLTAKLLTGHPLADAAATAAWFVREAIAETVKFPKITTREGVLFEKVLYNM